MRCHDYEEQALMIKCNEWEDEVPRLFENFTAEASRDKYVGFCQK